MVKKLLRIGYHCSTCLSDVSIIEIQPIVFKCMNPECGIILTEDEVIWSSGEFIDA